MIFKQLAVAISGLTHELGLQREERNRELATKADVIASEKRITEALQVSECDRQQLADVLARVKATVKRVEKLSKALSKLDART